MNDESENKKRIEQLTLVIKELEEFIKYKNVILAAAERRIMFRLSTNKKTLMYQNRKGTHKSFAVISNKAELIETKNFRRGVFYLRARKELLEKKLIELKSLDSSFDE